MSARKKTVDFAYVSGGKNSKDPQHALETNQVRDTRNVLHEKRGFRYAPGYSGFGSTALFTSKILGMFNYRTSTGVECLIGISNGKVYNIDVSAETKTEIGDMAGTGDVQAVNAVGFLWMVNGTSFVKVEPDLSVTPAQIAAPTGTSAALFAGGTLPDGVYGCYVSYARKDAFGRYHYSLPYSLGNVTLGGGNNTVRFTVPDSTDSQVTNKVFWMTDAGGATPYYYGETDNSTSPYDITSNANRSTSIRMDTNAASNEILPITPNGIFHFDDRLIVWSTDTFYYSMKTDINPLNIARFFPENTRTVSVVISSMFSVGVNAFINSVGNGIFIVPNADYTAVIKNINRRLWFNQVNTKGGRKYCVDYNGLVWGYTNDGIRNFNGSFFSGDLSQHIKPDIEKINKGVNVDHIPALVIYRREGLRTELRISYRNLDNATTINNEQLIFNIDSYF